MDGRSYLGLELNDAGLCLATGDRLLADSPGFVLHEADRLWVGEAAERRARHAPRQVNNRFWEQIGMEALARPLGHARTHADLAACHLEHVWEHAEPGFDGVIVAVSSTLERARVGILLGIAEQLSLPLAGLVDAALAAHVQAPGAGLRAVHVDATLHASTVTVVNGTATGGVEVESAERIAGTGLADLRERLARAVAARFVVETRFDPMHSGASEQQLHDALPGWLAQLEQAPEVRAELASVSGVAHGLVLRAADLGDVLAAWSAPLHGAVERAMRPGTQVLLGHRLAALPGFLDRVAAVAGTPARSLPRGAAALGAASAAGRVIAIGGPHALVTRLRPVADAPAPAPVAAPLQPARPTHVVLRGYAYPVVGRGARLGAVPAGDGLAVAGAEATCVLSGDGPRLLVEASGGGAWLNDVALEGPRALVPGDRLRPGAQADELLLVRLEAT